MSGRITGQIAGNASGEPIAFGGPGLDRADHIRSNPDALGSLMNSKARLLRMDGLDAVLTPSGQLSWGQLAEAPDGCDIVFLGLDQHHEACFVAVPRGKIPAGQGGWNAIGVLDSADLAIYGAARSLVDWHRRHGFCAECGSPSEIAKGGWQRTCTNPECHAEHFPRVDPVAIMLVEHDGKILLGRQPRFPPRRYSALAGFIEPGETIEGAVEREVMEEAGLTLYDVRYLISQPWPYPSSLMIGCHAFADHSETTMDATELEDLRWFTRDEVAEALDAMRRQEEGKAFIAPPVTAVANFLLRYWISAGE